MKKRACFILFFLLVALWVLNPVYVCSQGSCTVVADWSGGWCSICGGPVGNYLCSPDPWGAPHWGNGCKSFSDCIPAGNVIDIARIILYWNDGDCGGTPDNFNLTINGSSIGLISKSGFCACDVPGPSCIIDTVEQTCASITSSYNYGGANTFCLNYTGTGACADRAEITFYYSPSTPPAIPGTISGKINPCESSIQTYSISPVPDASSYIWTVPAGWTIISGQGDTSISAAAGASSGNVCVKACDTCECSPFSCLPVASVTISVNIGSDTIFCKGDTLVLDTGHPGAAYLWQDSSTAQMFNAAATGVYYVKVTDTNNCFGSDTINIWVDTLFDATIIPTGPFSFCIADAPVIITAADSGGIWAGNGITNVNTGAFNPATAGAGTHQITYTISGVCGDTDTAFITVYANPVVFLGNDTSFCQGNTLVLNAGNPGAAYFWQDSSANQTFNVTTTGQYYVQVTNTNGCKGYDTISVNVIPVSDATISPAGPFCVTDPAVTLTAADSGGQWSGIGITGVILGTFDPSVAGNGTHQIIYTIGGNCGDSDTTLITVNSNPTVLLGNDTSFCQSDTLVLDAGNPGASYLWQDSSSNQTFTVTATGQYYVQVTNTNGCKGSDTISVTVIPVSDATIGTAGPFCVTDLAVTLTATDSGGLWAGTGIINTNDGIFDPAMAGVGAHQITYTISAVCGDIDTVLITVNPTYNISDPVVAICTGDSALIYGTYRTTAGTYFNNLTTVTGCDSVHSTALTVNPTYNISDPAVALCTGDSALIYGTYRTIAGTYYDLLTTVSGCDSVHSTILLVNPDFSISTVNETVCDGDSVMIFGSYRKTAGTYYDSSITVNSCDSIIATTLIVNPLPVVNFSGLDTNYCSTDAGVTLTGTPAGGVFSGTGGIAGNQFFPATGVNTYTVTYSYTDSLGCSDSVSQSVSVVQCTGIPEDDRIPQIKIYPNPTPGQFTITFSNSPTGGKVFIYDLLGQTVLSQPLHDNRQRLNLAAQQAGVYFVKVVTGEGIFTAKLVLAR